MGRPKRVWSEDDDKLVSSKLPRKDICTKLDISPFTLTKRRRQLGLIIKGKHDEAVKAGWAKIPQKILADQLGMSISNLQRIGKRLGLKNLYVEWTPERESWLVSNIETVGKKKAAKHFNCSVRAITIKLWMLGIDEDMQRNELTMEFVAQELLNVSYDTLHRWIRMRLLKTIKKEGGRRLIRPKTLRKFIIENPERIDPKKLGEGWPMFISLVGGQWG